MKHKNEAGRPTHFCQLNPSFSSSAATNTTGLRHTLPGLRPKGEGYASSHVMLPITFGLPPTLEFPSFVSFLFFIFHYCSLLFSFLSLSLSLSLFFFFFFLILSLFILFVVSSPSRNSTSGILRKNGQPNL
uniref:Transmembrane protein n=1 Tax=Trypanosoma vivax (strain Y486) TaxID=1055687 RepID=G0U7G1_TRYVY|nr:hypothetical protein, unlikely [Trypanosoma vivax Y486]